MREYVRDGEMELYISARITHDNAWRFHTMKLPHGRICVLSTVSCGSHSLHTDLHVCHMGIVSSEYVVLCFVMLKFDLRLERVGLSRERVRLGSWA